MSKTEEKQRKQPFFTASRMAAIAIFAVVGGILYPVQIPMPVMFPFWLKFNASDVPVLIGTFALGAPSGAIIAVLRTLIGLIFKPTTSAFIGEAADILCGVALAVPAGLFYAKKKSKGGAGIACLLGGLCSVAVALLANRFMMIPWYAKQMGMGALVEGMQMLFPKCTEETFYDFYLWFSVAPFNAFRCLLNSLFTFSIYKNVSALLKKMNEKFAGEKPPEQSDGENAGNTSERAENAGENADNAGEKNDSNEQINEDRSKNA